MKAIINANNIVIAVGDDGQYVEQGILMNDSIYIEEGLQLIDVEDGSVEPFKHIIIDGVIYNNPDYPYIPNEIEGAEYIKQLLKRTAEQDAVIEELLFNIIPSLMGGEM